MGWRKTGIFNAPEEIRVLTCDVCECDIGHEDGRRPRAHFEVSRLPNTGTMDDQTPTATICSRQCLRAFAASAEGPDRAPPVAAAEKSPGRP
jgi:hypothetical protein